MENKELTHTDAPVQGIAPGETPVENSGNSGAVRGRRHRRPAASKTAGNTADTTEQPTPAEGPVAEAAATNPVTTVAAGDTAPAKAARTTHHRRGGRPRAGDAAASKQPPVTPPEVAVAPTVAEPLPATLQPLEPSWRPEDAPLATPPLDEPAPQTPAPAPEAVEPTRPARRYRFDRPAPKPVVTPATVTTEPRPLGPLSTIWSRPTPPVVSTPEIVTFTPITPERDEPEVIAPVVDESALAAEVETPLSPIEPELEPEPELEAEPAVSFDAVEEAAPAATAPVAPPAVNTDDDANGIGGNGRHKNNRRRRGRGNGNGLSTDSRADEDATMPPMAASTHTVTAQPRFQPAAPSFFEPTTITNVIAPSVLPPAAAPAPIAPTPSPYGSPEPMHARGFGPTPRGVATEYRAMPAPRISRVERNNENNAPFSPNHLASVLMEAIQQQTDRLLNEQRRNSATPAFTVSMPSTERVGVFVDVANLLYSSRSMRIPIDFGKLLNFLRGDRRLIRAHAYCPTSPEPYADQQFLQAVKGLGYRITTKDYKTFSSGAKKADLDLDLCMDIVRIVDAGAVDTIVLVSGDSDFLPLLAYCSDHGVRVEVAAFDESTAAILRQICDLFMNLSLVEEIRA